jgi:hypothetical protein
LLGVDLGDVLAPLKVGARYQRAVLGGVVDVYPLAIPDGEGLEVPVKLLGALGFYNLHGLLVLVVPPAVAEAVREQLAGEIAASGRGRGSARRCVRPGARAGASRAVDGDSGRHRGWKLEGRPRQPMDSPVGATPEGVHSGVATGR